MMAMMVMSKPKKASNFLRPAEEGTRSSDWLIVDLSLLKMLLKHRNNSRPYLSRKRKKNVSMMVMRTPAHRGILSGQTHTRC